VLQHESIFMRTSQSAIYRVMETLFLQKKTFILALLFLHCLYIWPIVNIIYTNNQLELLIQTCLQTINIYKVRYVALFWQICSDSVQGPCW